MTTIKVRRGTAAQWASANPVLAAGEPGWETDTGVYKVGDGSTAWASLNPVLNNTFAQYMAASQQFSLPRVSKKLSAMNSAVGQLKVLHFGDSYGQKIPAKLYPLMESIAGGNAGGGLVDGAGTTLSGQMVTSATTGTVTNDTTDFDAWPSGLVQSFATSATRTYQATGGSFVGDTVKVYYVLEPGAGTFKIQIDGVDTTYTNVSAVGTLGSLGVATASTTRGQHTVKIVNLTGTVRIAYLAYYDSTNSGIVTLPVCQGGIALNSATTTAWSNFQAFLADISPDLMTFEMKESVTYGDGSTFAQAIVRLFTATAAGASGMDVIGIGSPPVASLDSEQVANNTTLRAACSTYGYVYWDSYAIFGSYARLTALGWNGDGTHVSTDCDEWRAMLMARDSGLLALYKRSLDGGNVISRGLTLARAGDTSGGANTATFGTSRQILRPEASFGFDLEIVPGRWMKFLKNDGSTEIARLDGTTSGTTNFMPDKTRVGSTTGPAWAVDAQTRVSVRDGSNLSNPAEVVGRALFRTPVTMSNQSGTVTMNISSGTVFYVTLTGNVTSWSFSNAPNITGMVVEVQFIQDSTGSRTLAGANSLIRLAGGALTLTTTASHRDIIRFSYSAGGTWNEISRSMDINAG